MQEHGGNIAHLVRETGHPGKNYTDFSANINPYGVPQEFKKIIQDNLEQIAHYPDYTYLMLKESLATFYAVKLKSLIIGNGAEEIIRTLMPLLPQKIILVEPTFSEYRRVAELNQKEIHSYILSAEKKFRFDQKLFYDYITQLETRDVPDGTYTGAVFICNPNNPTGQLMTKDRLKELARGLEEKNYLLILDESFIEFVPDYEAVTMLSEVELSPNLIVIQSLTKFYAIPGLRLGFGAIGNAELKQKFERSQGTWTINTFAECCGRAIHSLDEYRKNSVIYYLREKAYLTKELSLFSQLQLYDTAANFLFIKSERVDIFEQLLAEGVVVRSCRNFVGLNDHFFRVAVRTKEENQHLVKVFKTLMGQERHES